MLKATIYRQFSLVCSQFRFEALRNVIFNNKLQLLSSRLFNVYLSRAPYCSATDKNKIESQPRNLKGRGNNKKNDKPVDWLPFEWDWREMYNPFQKSGDLVKELEYDPAWPKPDFELSDELKTASEEVKRIFSLSTASKAEIKEVVKRNILKKVQRHPNDFESLEVKIALRTIMVRSLFEHARYKETGNSRNALYMMINKRNRLVKTLYREDRERFNWIIEELKLEYTPKPLGGRPQFYCKKWDLRRLTRLWCKNVENKKKQAYHEELKLQQADFLKEKEEILAWIQKEEEELAKLTV